MNSPWDWLEEIEPLFPNEEIVSLSSFVLPVSVLLIECLTRWWSFAASCRWWFRLCAEVKLPLVRLVDEVTDTLSPQILLLVPMLSWLFKDMRDPLVIPLEVEAVESIFAVPTRRALVESAWSNQQKMKNECSELCLEIYKVYRLIWILLY